MIRIWITIGVMCATVRPGFPRFAHIPARFVGCSSAQEATQNARLAACSTLILNICISNAACAAKWIPIAGMIVTEMAYITDLYF